jgi:hypothetical protein
MVTRLLLFLGRGLRDFGFALFCVPHDGAHPGFATSPGHPERVIPLAVLPEEERRWWKELERRLW